MGFFARIKSVIFSRSAKMLGMIFVILVGSVLFFGVTFNYSCRNSQPNFKPIDVTKSKTQIEAESKIENYNRPEKNTYLTFPDWFVVYNTQEYGKFIGEKKPSAFPYFSSIGQFWGGYCRMYGITKNNYPFNIRDHVSKAVTGVSFSIEHILKGVWENTFGRISELTNSGEPTQEDIYAAKTAIEYGNFISTRPWFQFSYGQKFTGLWKTTDLWGDHAFRKWERKIFLSIEYAIKTVYGGVIRIGTHSVYEIADTEIHAYVENTPLTIFKNVQIKKVTDMGNRSFIITLPNHQGFTDTIPFLAKQKIKFVDIAGNDEILLTAIAPRDWKYNLASGKLLFAMDMITNPETKRITIQSPTLLLSEILNEMSAKGIRFEHTYDY